MQAEWKWGREKVELACGTAAAVRDCAQQVERAAVLLFQVKRRTKRLSELFQSYLPYEHKVHTVKRGGDALGSSHTHIHTYTFTHTH